MEQPLILRLCGAPSLTRNDQLLTHILTGKTLALFLYLAATRRSHSRETLAHLLWSELPSQQARNNLRYLLSDLRRVVGDYLTIAPQTISFNAQRPYWLDIEVLETTLTQASAEVSLLELQSALDLYQGEFLAGFTVRNAPVFETWVASQRTALHSQVTQGFYQVAERHWQTCNFQAGLTATQRLLALEPWHEAGHRLRMLLLLYSGQRSAALAQFAECQRLLAEELGAPPEAETVALYEQIRSGLYEQQKKRADTKNSNQESEAAQSHTGDHAAALPPPHVVLAGDADGLPHNLPGQLTPFVGRKAEVKQICALLADFDHRLLTLTGLGGSGKTRLALAVGQRLLNSADRHSVQPHPPYFPDGVWFVPLVGMSAGDNLADRLALAIADALQLPLSGPVAALDQLLDALRHRQLLLLLDNFEHLLAGSDVLLTLLQHTTRVKMLITSRLPLNLPGEYVWQLTGLATPALTGGIAMTLEDVQKYDSVALFAERAQRAHRTFQLNQNNLTDVLQICRLVEGLPLGLELAASMLRHTTPRQLWQTLQHDYRVLAATQRDLAPRHRSMTAVFERSWQLLTSTQTQVLAACSLFPQTFTPEAALAVADATPAILATLVEYSLLKKTEDGHFEFHELVRQYAADRFVLEPQEVARRRQRHAAYYSSLVEADTNALLRSPAKFQQVQQELPNLRLAWQWALEQQQTTILERLRDSIFFHYQFHGPLEEGLEWLTTSIQLWRQLHPAAMTPEQLRLMSLGLGASCYYAYYLGRYDDARQFAQEAIAVAQPLGEMQALAMAYNIEEMVCLVQGELDDQADCFQQALTYAYASELPYMIAVTLAYRCFGLTVQGKTSAAQDALYEGLQLLHQHGLILLEGYLLSELSFVYAMAGDWALANDITQQALAMGQSTNSSLNRGYQYERLALSAEAVGYYPRAVLYTDKALAFMATFHDPTNRLGTLLIRGRALRHLGDLPAATVTLQQALALAEQLQRPAETARVQIELGHLLLAGQNWARAATHYEAVLDRPTTPGLPWLAAHAGLARLHFAQNRLAAARARVEMITPVLLNQALDGHYDVVNAALAAHQVLAAQQDPRGVAIVQRTQAWVETQAQKISDEILRRSFLENVATHQQLFALTPHPG